MDDTVEAIDVVVVESAVVVKEAAGFRDDNSLGSSILVA